MSAEHSDPPTIALDGTNTFYDKERGEYVEREVVQVRCRDEDEARRVAQAITEEYKEDKA